MSAKALRIRTQGTRRRFRRGVPTGTALLAAVGLIFASPAMANGRSSPATAPQATPQPKVVIISPLLSIFSFGSTFGLPELCTNGVDGMLSVATAIPGATAPANAFATRFASACAEMAKDGGQYIAAFNGMLGPLTALNPLFDGYIERFAQATQDFGSNYGSSLAPLGGLIAGFAGDIRFFEGS